MVHTSWVLRTNKQPGPRNIKKREKKFRWGEKDFRVLTHYPKFYYTLPFCRKSNVQTEYLFLLHPGSAIFAQILAFAHDSSKEKGKKQNKKNRAHKKPGETQERDVCTFFQSVTFRIQSPPSKASVFLCPLLCNKLEKEEGQGSDFENPEFQGGLLFNVFCGFDWSRGYGFWLNVLLWKIF